MYAVVVGAVCDGHVVLHLMLMLGYFGASSGILTIPNDSEAGILPMRGRENFKFRTQLEQLEWKMPFYLISDQLKFHFLQALRFRR